MPSIASAVLMCLVLSVIYPHFQFYVDPDDTAYLTISHRYAIGDIQRAINGYWSPWACWLTAGLIKSGLQPIPAGVIVNSIGALGFLFISQSFFLRFKISVVLQWLFSITLSLFLCYAIFDQSFDDLWECFFLLASLRIMIAQGFKDKPVLWVALGVVGAFAYFAKAYSFPFFILNTICCTYFICSGNKIQWLKISFTAICVLVLCSLPWVWSLHNKYGIWTTSTAGTLNTSWYLVGHPYWREGINYLLPPAYSDSPYYWEDPWLVNGATPHFWNSWHLLGLQILRLGYNLWKLLRSMVQLSIFFPLITVILVRFAKVTLRSGTPNTPNFSVALFFLLFPLGYLLVNFEPRYIWFMLPLSMTAGGLFILNHLSSNEDVKILRIVPYLFALSYLIYPAWRMMKMYNEGKNEYDNAQLLRQADIRGTFTSNASPGLETQRMVRLAYFSGNPYYVIPKRIPEKELDTLFNEMHRYQVKYYISYRNDSVYDEATRQHLPEIHIHGLKDIKIFKLN